MEIVDCKVLEVVYRVKWMGMESESKFCKSFFFRETSRCVGEHFTDRLRKYKAKLDKSVFWLHCRDDHNRVFQRLEVNFECELSSDAMLRQVSEAVLVE